MAKEYFLTGATNCDSETYLSTAICSIPENKPYVVRGMELIFLSKKPRAPGQVPFQVRKGERVYNP